MQWGGPNGCTSQNFNKKGTTQKKTWKKEHDIRNGVFQPSLGAKNGEKNEKCNFGVSKGKTSHPWGKSLVNVGGEIKKKENGKRFENHRTRVLRVVSRKKKVRERAGVSGKKHIGKI